MADEDYILVTETQNENSMHIDKVDTIDALRIMNNEDKKVAYAVEKSLDDIALAVDKIVERMQKGGRLLYFGAGTSGRLAILDAAECPPTFGTDPEMVQGIMAGGKDALSIAKEDMEDHKTEGILEAEKNRITEKDSIIGLSASGQAPYIIGVVEEAKRRGALTISITCNEKSPMDDIVDVKINTVVGPEVLMGSTRLKAGTAQKMILNMISTTVMIKLGKVYKNLMVDLKPKNRKLVERAKRIIMLGTGVSYEEAERYFELSKRNPKLAIVMIETKSDFDRAQKLLEEAGGFVSKAISIAGGTEDLTR
ncbi:MAG: N-acetylmuramic acid 6-phosphate etherase [Caldicoprobacterales bacterium]|jgi:N-acetylmuramic acid 6-phosphate etherase